MKIIFLLFFIKLINADYCECTIAPLLPGKSYEQSYIEDRAKSANLILYGPVLELRDMEMPGYDEVIKYPDPSPDSTDAGRFPYLAVKKVYKGQIEDKTIQIYQDWSNCDTSFKSGKNYLVMAHYDEGKYYTSSCTVVREIPSKKELRKILRFAGLK